MSSFGFRDRRPHGVLLKRLLWPTAILFAATLWVVFSTILWTSDSVNESSARRESEQLKAAIDQELLMVGGRLLELAAVAQNPDGDASGESIVGTLPTPAEPLAVAGIGFDSLFLLDANGVPMPVGGVGHSSANGNFDAYASIAAATLAAARFKTPVRETPLQGSVQAASTGRESVVANLVAAGDKVLEVAALPLVTGGTDQSPGSRSILLGVRKADDVLRKLAALHGLENFRVRSSPANNVGALPLGDGNGGVAAYLTWSAERPGDLMRERLVPLTLIGFCVAALLFGFVTFYLHSVANDLADSQTRSQELLGRDPLSGLANRLLFGERLDRALEAMARATDGAAVLFIDLDRFKDVNDTYGHQAGDDLIQLVANRLMNLLRSADTLARFGGDEFAIVQTGVRTSHDAEALARRILDALTRPFAIAQTQVIIGASIGIAVAPEHGKGREVLMGLADTALYQAKSEGRNRYCLFQARMDETIRMRKVVEEDLRRAIAEDELVLHYQPLYSSDGENIVGLEALVRWAHPVRGMIAPGEFIAIAEERGLIIPLSEWVLRRACEDGKRWPGLRMAVNVSPIQFRHRSFVESIMRSLEETGFDPARLELELTEGVVVEDADAAEAAMMDLRALGVHLALDDFGTGYSSLIYLRRFAFDKIKIDRSFLESMEATGESAILVHSIVHLGRALGLTVTAEGVETKEQHRFLQALGCHQLQGFLFSPPVPAHEIDRLLGLEAGRLPAATAA